VTNELEMVREEVTVTHYKIVLQNLVGEAEENYVKLQSRQLTSGSKFQSGTSTIWKWSASHL